MSREAELNRRPTRYECVALPTELSRLKVKSRLSPRTGLNRRPTHYHCVALPTELPGHIQSLSYAIFGHFAKLKTLLGFNLCGPDRN